MPIFRQKRKFKLAHYEPSAFWLDYVLLPVGYSYNADVAGAKAGDVIRFFDGGEYTVLACRRIKAKSTEADLLCRMRYGISMAGAMSRWRANAQMEGHGAQAVSNTECLWIVFNKDEQDETGRNVQEWRNPQGGAERR